MPTLRASTLGMVVQSLEMAKAARCWRTIATSIPRVDLAVGQSRTPRVPTAQASTASVVACVSAESFHNQAPSQMPDCPRLTDAAEWTGSLINIYFFPRSSIPADITNQTPNPSGWGTPSASFSGCDFSSHIDQNQIILDQTFCGQWGGSEWSTDSVW